MHYNWILDTSDSDESDRMPKYSIKIDRSTPWSCLSKVGNIRLLCMFPLSFVRCTQHYQSLSLKAPAAIRHAHAHVKRTSDRNVFKLPQRTQRTYEESLMFWAVESEHQIAFMLICNGMKMDWEWNGREWPIYLERGHHTEDFDGHIACTLVDGYGVMKDFISWTQDGMEDSSWRLWRFLQTLSCCSNLLQFRRCGSRRACECLGFFVCDLLSENVYVVQLLLNWLSAYKTWHSSWIIVTDGLTMTHQHVFHALIWLESI